MNFVLGLWKIIKTKILIIILELIIWLQYSLVSCHVRKYKILFSTFHSFYEFCFRSLNVIPLRARYKQQLVTLENAVGTIFSLKPSLMILLRFAGPSFRIYQETVKGKERDHFSTRSPKHKRVLNKEDMYGRKSLNSLEWSRIYK